MTTTYRVRRMQVTSNELLEAEMEARADNVNKCGVVVLGLSRPQRLEVAGRTTVDRCTIMLIGWFSDLESDAQFCEEENLLSEIFRFPNEAISNRATPALFLDVVRRFLETRCSPDDKSALWRLRSILSQQEAPDIDFRLFSDCAVVFRRLGHRHEYTVTLLGPPDKTIAQKHIAASELPEWLRRDRNELVAMFATNPRHHGAPWATMRALVRFLIVNVNERPPLLYKKFVADLNLWLLERQLRIITPHRATPPAIDILMHMFARVGRKGSRLIERGGDVGDFEQRCKTVRSTLEQTVARRGICNAARFALTPPAEERITDASIRISSSAAFVNPDRRTLVGDVLTTTIDKNLRAVNMLLPQQWSDLWAWMMKSSRSQARPNLDFLAVEVVLRTVESFVFSRAIEFHSLHLQEVQCLENIVDLYRNLSRQFTEKYPLQEVEQRSLERLVVWVAYCLVHSLTKRTHAVLGDFGVGLQAAELRYLVLPNRLSFDALCSTHAYLSENTISSLEVFSLRDEGPTFRLALSYADKDGEIHNILAAEVRDAEKRVDAHWKEVLRKQEEARKLRLQIASRQEELRPVAEKFEQFKAEETELIKSTAQRDACDRKIRTDRAQIARYENNIAAFIRTHRTTGISHCRSEIQSLESSVTNGEASLSTWAKRCDQYRSRMDQLGNRPGFERTIRDLNQQIAKLSSDLADAEKPPPAVYQPLPINKERALVVLFFLRMPFMFRALSRMSFLAQETLLPWPLKGRGGRWDITKCTQMSDFATSWSKHYNEKQTHNAVYHRPAMIRSGVDGAVEFVSSRGVPPESGVNPLHVDQMTSRLHGIWYPDSLDFHMAWKSGGGLFNPFARIPHDMFISFFTQQLVGDDSQLQWMMPLPDHPQADRGNLVYARQDEKPPWLRKEAFIALGDLRAYPNAQLRKLCIALKKRSLPLGHQAVTCLIRQLLFQCGAIDPSSVPICKTELFQSDSDFLQTFAEELRSCANEFCQKPREHRALHTLGEIASFVAAWKPACAEISRNLAAAAWGWACALVGQMAAADRKLRDSLRAKQCLFAAYSVLAHSGVELTSRDVCNLCSSMAWVRNGLLFDAVKQQPALPDLVKVRKDLSTYQNATMT